MTELAIRNRVTEMTGNDYPIIQAPLGKFSVMDDLQKLYSGGDMEAAVPLSGRVTSRAGLDRSSLSACRNTAMRRFRCRSRT